MIRLPMIQTERLILREISILDAVDMYEYSKDPLVGPLAGWAPHRSIDESLGVIGMFLDAKKRGEPGVYAIVLKSANKMIGTIELYNHVPSYKAELGYSIASKYWGQGYATEAAKAVVDVGFKILKLKRIEASTYVDNYQSQRVCEKVGFQKEGIARNGYLRYDGQIFDKLVYGITDEDYFNQ